METDSDEYSPGPQIKLSKEATFAKINSQVSSESFGKEEASTSVPKRRNPFTQKTEKNWTQQDFFSSQFKNSQNALPLHQPFDKIQSQSSHDKNTNIVTSSNFNKPSQSVNEFSQRSDDPSQPKKVKVNPFLAHREKKINSEAPVTNPFAKTAALSSKNQWEEYKKARNPIGIRESFANIPKRSAEVKQGPLNSDQQKKEEPPVSKNPFESFKTGRQAIDLQQNQVRFKGLSKSAVAEQNPLLKKFKSPLITSDEEPKPANSENENPLLKGFDKAILERIEREIVSNPSEVTWDDIVGLDAAKQVINESITIAMNHPEFFTGLRTAPRAILFFGPPGTGKTLIGKCIASSCSATFMSISASSLTSKWIGESESLVRAMFAYARLKQPSVIFFDEIDSLLEKRDSEGGGGGGNEVYNRIKTEFLVQLDGVSAMSKNDRVLFIAATNLPHKIDEAILRRFAKRIYVPLPIDAARVALFKNLLASERHRLREEHFQKLGELSAGYSGSDINQVCKEAAMKPLRKVSNVLANLTVDEIPPISFKHFVKAFRDIKPSVSPETIKVLEKWNESYGFSANLSQSDEDDSDDDSDY